jgi:hypothetical protein
MMKAPQRPCAPAHLDPEESALWDSIVATYRFDDSASLELLVVAMEARQRSRVCREKIKLDGLVVLDDHNTLKGHPLLQVERAAWAAFLSAMRLLRLDYTGEKK